jgi:hypothetical protein
MVVGIILTIGNIFNQYGNTSPLVVHSSEYTGLHPYGLVRISCTQTKSFCIIALSKAMPSIVLIYLSIISNPLLLKKGLAVMLTSANILRDQVL